LVELQQSLRDTPHFRHRLEAAACEAKMIVPILAAGVKKCDDLTGLWVNRTQVAPFELIAEGTNVTHAKLTGIDPL